MREIQVLILVGVEGVVSLESNVVDAALSEPNNSQTLEVV